MDDEGQVLGYLIKISGGYSYFVKSIKDYKYLLDCIKDGCYRDNDCFYDKDYDYGNPDPS